eukprot:4054921-Pyramimonas_sp.AAC.1
MTPLILLCRPITLFVLTGIKYTAPFGNAGVPIALPPQMLIWATATKTKLRGKDESERGGGKARRASLEMQGKRRAEKLINIATQQQAR